jgi:hypothetical protein
MLPVACSKAAETDAVDSFVSCIDCCPFFGVSFTVRYEIVSLLGNLGETPLN